MVQQKVVQTTLRALVFTSMLMYGFTAQSNDSCVDNKSMTDTCWYAIGSMGVSKLNPNENSSGFITIVDENDPLTANFDTFDDRNAAVKITAGYIMNDHWFGEVSYINLGRAQLAHANPALPQNMTIDYSGVTFSTGYWLFDKQDKLNVFVRAGLGAINTESNYEQYHEKQHSAQIVVGLGVQWRIGDHWVLRAEVDGLEKDAQYIGISMGRFFSDSERKYKVKKQAQSSRSQIANTESVAKSTPTLAPKLEPVLVKKPQTVTAISKVESKIVNVENEILDVESSHCAFSVDSKTEQGQTCKTLEEITLNIQFESNSTYVNTEYLKQIKEVVDTINKYKYQDRYENVNVTVEGHSDSVGSVLENQLLSETRATEVKDILLYLSGGKPADYLAVGKGELYPIADNDNSKVRHKNRRVVIIIQSKLNV